jgi:fumarylacetoacetase
MESYSHHFSSLNIPFGIGSCTSHPSPQAVTRIANTVIFLHDVAKAGHFSQIEGLPQTVFDQSVLNDFASLGRAIHQGVRIAIQKLHETGTPWPDGSTEEAAKVAMHLPVWIGDFTGGASSSRVFAPNK